MNRIDVAQVSKPAVSRVSKPANALKLKGRRKSRDLINTPPSICLAQMDAIGQSHPSPRPSPREGRGRNNGPPKRERMHPPSALAAGPPKPAVYENQQSPYVEQTGDALPLSPQRGEGRGEGCDWSTTSARAKQVQLRQLLAQRFPNARIIKYHSLAASKSDEGGSNSHPSTVWPTGIPQIDH